MATEIAFSALNTWLSNQPANTASTPYQLNITGLTSQNISNAELTYSLGYVLKQHSTKYVDLSATVLPTVTSMNYVFRYCSSLVVSPTIPNGVTMMYYTFSGTSLVNSPIIPDSVTDMYATFYNCSSLVNAPIIPESVTDMSMTFENCVSLSYKPVVSSSTSYTARCFYNVSTPNWKGTDTQIRNGSTYFEQETLDGEILIYEEDKITYLGTAYNINLSNLSTWLGSSAANTVQTAYKIYVRGLTNLNTTGIKTALTANPTKYVDLDYSIVPDSSDMGGLFEDCTTLTVAPSLSSNATSLSSTFANCTNLLKAPTIPNTVTKMESTFFACKSLTTPPVIPSGVTNMRYCFGLCENLQTTPNFPSGLTRIDSAFYNCKSITTVPNMPNSITNLQQTFYGCISLQSVGTLPSSVTNLYETFRNCTNITNIKNVPSTVTDGRKTFKDCTQLKTIDGLEIPLSTLKNNSNFQNMFDGCSSLESIGFKIDTDTWHAWRLKFDANSVEGKIFGFNNGQLTSTAVLNTQISKNDIRLPVLTDELWFPPANMSDSDVEDVIRSVLNNRYTYWNKAVIDPNSKSLVMMASDPNNVVSNFLNGGGGGGVEKLVISTTRSVNVTKDTRIFADGSAITITLNYGSSAEGYVAEVYAIQACTITYYTAQGTTTSLAMEAGGKAIFVYFSGWKLHSNYGTTNSVAVDNMQSVSSSAVARAISDSVLISNVLIGTYTLQAGQTISPDITNSIPPTLQGYTRFTQVYGTNQNYLQTSVQFVGNRVYMTATNHHSGALTYDIYTWVMYYKNAQYI